MYKDYKVLLQALDLSLEEIKKIARERELTPEEFEYLFASIVDGIKAEEVKEISVQIPQPVYAPPQMFEERVVREERVQAIYAAPVPLKDERVEVKVSQPIYAPPKYDEKEVHVIRTPQPVYAPPQFMQGEVHAVQTPQPVYAPPSFDADIEELEDMLDDKIGIDLSHSEELIPGTDIYRPRYRNNTESDEEYEAYLANYYEHHFPGSKREFEQKQSHKESKAKL